MVKNRGTIDWHANLKKKSAEEIVEEWRKAPGQKQVWENFSTWVNRFQTYPGKVTEFCSPIASGYNIVNYDNKITARLNAQYNIKTMFHNIYKLDLLDTVFYWFENSTEVNRYNMDHLRTYFGIDATDAHNAVKDVKDTARFLIKFLKLSRMVAPKVQFKDSFRDEPGIQV